MTRRKQLTLAIAVVSLLSFNAAVIATRTVTSADAAPARIARSRPPPPTTTPPTVHIPRQSHPVAPAGPSGGERVVRIGTMSIPKIGLTHPIYEGVTLKVINHGPSHWPGTALPGEAGNAVFAGHRTTYSKPFRNIDQLVAGDEVIFEVNGKRSVYHVTGHEIVKPKDVWIANQTPDATGTLFACHPPGSKAFRYVARLKLVG